MIIDITSFKQATLRLQEILVRYNREPEDLVVQDSVVLRFKYTYELAYKTLKRFLTATSANPSEIDAMSFQDIVRTGNEKGLLKGNVGIWLKYRDKRNITSQADDSNKAKEVIALAPKFYKEAEYLLDHLSQRNDQ